MIQASFDSDIVDLKSFYKSIRMQQEKAHGEFYCAHHDLIQKYLPKNGSYKELGTHQGATAAAALLHNPKKMHLVDLSFTLFDATAKDIFERHCIEHNITLTKTQCSSVDSVSVNGEHDILLIDSYHIRPHMEKELALHHKYITSHIIFHDTVAVPSLLEGIQHFCLTNPWRIVEHIQYNVGSTAIERIR